MSQQETITRMSGLISNEVKMMCEMTKGPFKPGKSNKWSAPAGQLIVYGYEKVLGFGGAAQLCAVVEKAYTKGEEIEPVISKFLTDLVNSR